MDTNLLFLDECDDSTHSGIIALTGVVVPIEQYGPARHRFYEDLSWAIQTGPATINVNPPVLKGSDLLRDETDERKLEAVEAIVRLIEDFDLRIVRVGYFYGATEKKMYGSAFNFFGTCWFGIVAKCQPLMKSSIVAPIMDGLDPRIVQSFSSPVRDLAIMRSIGMENVLSFEDTQQLTEVFYADDTYSVFGQVADIAGYLRHVSDWDREGRELSTFKRGFLPLSDRLAPFLDEDVIRMKWDKATPESTA